MRLRLIFCLIRLSPIILMLAFWELGPAAPHGCAQLQAGISTQEQLDTSDPSRVVPTGGHPCANLRLGLLSF